MGDAELLGKNLRQLSAQENILIKSLDQYKFLGYIKIHGYGIYETYVEIETSE